MVKEYENKPLDLPTERPSYFEIDKINKKIKVAKIDRRARKHFNRGVARKGNRSFSTINTFRNNSISPVFLADMAMEVKKNSIKK